MKQCHFCPSPATTARLDAKGNFIEACSPCDAQRWQQQSEVALAHADQVGNFMDSVMSMWGAL